MIRKIGQILLGLILSAGVAIAMGTWGLPEEKDLIAEAGMIRITASMYQRTGSAPESA